MAADFYAKTLTTVDDLLKERWLPGFQKAFYQSNILLTRLRRRVARVSGQQYQFAIHAQRNSGTGPRAESGVYDPIGSAAAPYLPFPGAQRYDQGVLSRTHYYARFKVTGAALSAGRSDGAVIDLLDHEMRGAREDMSDDISMDMYGDGSGALCTFQTTASNTIQPGVLNAQRLHPGMLVVTAESTGANAVNNEVDSIVDNGDGTSTVTFDTTFDSSDKTHIFRFGGGGGTAASYNVAITGLEAALNSTTNTYASIDRTAAGAGFWHPSRIDGSGGLSIDLMLQAQHLCMTKASGKPSLILCSYPQWRAYGNLHDDLRRWTGTSRKLDYGFEALDFNGIPVVPDKYCPHGTMFFIDESTFDVLEEEPVGFMDRDGAVLVRVGSGITAEDAYEATLVWRGNLCCKNPAKNAVIHSLP